MLLYSKIQNLISLGTEGGYWDFKQEWYSNDADLLHDIICMANNVENCDSYIIIGVTDNGDICGVSDTNRKTQQNLIDFLKDKDFAGGIRPIVYVNHLYIDSKQIDVIIVKNTNNTPYYLNKDYKGVFRGNIYTRIIDTNTPKNNYADIDKVEWLWKKRFGLVGDLNSRLKRILESDGWVCEDLGEYQQHFFNEYYPEIRIDINEEETETQKEICTSHDCFFYLYTNIMFWDLNNTKLIRKCYDIRLYGNRIKQFFTISALKMDFDLVEPKIKYLDSKIDIPIEDCIGSYLGAAYCYFIEDSYEYILLKTIISLQSEDATNGRYGNSDVFCSSVIPVFLNEEEHSEFMDSILENKTKFKLEYSNMDVKNTMFYGAMVKNDPRIEQSYKVGTLLVIWLDNWRENID